MTSPTTPRDAIGLSERLREPVCLAYDAEQINAERREAATQLDALSARVKEDATGTANLISIIANIRERSGVGGKPMLSELADAIGAKIEATESRATRAEQERDRVQSELDTANDNHRAMDAQLARIGQERDEALERAAQCAECIADEYDATFTSVVADQAAALRSKEQAAHEIAAAIRHLASGPDKEKRWVSPSSNTSAKRHTCSSGRTCSIRFEMKDDADARANAECNPGTTRVEDISGRVVWRPQ